MLVDGETRAISEGPAGTRLVRVEGLEPDTDYRIGIEAAAAAFAAFRTPHHAFLGNHDYYGLNEGLEVLADDLMEERRFGVPRCVGGRRRAGVSTVGDGKR